MQLTDFIEVERILPGDGTVESGFEEGRPDIGEDVGASLVVLTHPAHTGIYSLRGRQRGQGLIQTESRLNPTGSVDQN